ncbi:MAG: D-aminoacyl-tRNA deacylase [Pseudomonadota bacterium]
MKVLIQRVAKASVEVEGEVVGKIGTGLVLFFCAEVGDEETQIEKLANKVANLRIFPDNDGKMNLSVSDIKGEVLSISQFTLAADVEKGNRPSFTKAMPPEEAARFYTLFSEALEMRGLKVAKGIFAAHMLVNISNDGPVTIMIGV